MIRFTTLILRYAHKLRTSYGIHCELKQQTEQKLTPTLIIMFTTLTSQASQLLS